MTKDEIYKQAWYQWGANVNLAQLQEELAELIVAVSHLRRFANDIDKKEQVVANFAEEIADVLIMIEEIMLVMPETAALARHYQMIKLSQLEMRLAGEEENGRIK